MAGIRRFPPYAGSDPYLYFCFAERDRETVFPLLEQLFLRGCRIWYSPENTADIGKLNHQQERINNASLVVAYLSENARIDERIKASLLYCQQTKPVICIDTDDGDNELVFGLTASARHVDGKKGRNIGEVEADLIREEGFSQELIGDPVRNTGSGRKGLTVALITAAAVAAAVMTLQIGRQQLGWFPTPSPPPSVSAAAETLAPSVMPDTVSFDDEELTETLRETLGGGQITEERLGEIKELILKKAGGNLSFLDQLPNLETLKVPQSLAAEVLTAAEERGITLVILPEEGAP